MPQVDNKKLSEILVQLGEMFGIKRKNVLLVMGVIASLFINFQGGKQASRFAAWRAERAAWKECRKVCDCTKEPRRWWFRGEEPKYKWWYGIYGVANESEETNGVGAEGTETGETPTPATKAGDTQPRTPFPGGWKNDRSV